MKTIYFIFFIFFLRISSFAQYIVTQNGEGGPLRNKDGSFIQKATSLTEEGSPTLPERNCLVALKTRDGKVYNNITGRIDLQNDVLIFTLKEQELLCTLPVAQIVFDSCEALLKSAIFKTGYPSIDKQNDKSFYQLLSGGKATLLKHYSITWQDRTAFNTNNTTRIYKRSEQYYLYLKGQMFRLEKNKSNPPIVSHSC